MRFGIRSGALIVALLFLFLSPSGRAQLPPPPFPPENPPSPEKAILGKILFWDEQLSSDDTVACGTCHRFQSGGSDPRAVALRGRDGVLGTPDDVFGSPGVVRSDASNDYLPHPEHGFRPQVTSRHSPTFLAAGYFSELFWDGRARGRFVDPVSGEQRIAAGGALESQSVGPPLSSVEMAHEGRQWSEITAKLERVSPLRLAANLPPDVASALAIRPAYPDLFAAAFGDPAITATRIALAIATYERTLVPDQTPWDRFNQGDAGALTPAQRAGLALFMGRANCSRCHTPGLFSDDRFHNIGLRPSVEDRGRQAVTGSFADRGKMKTPTLRNAGLLNRFMHTGQFQNMGQVIAFYNGGGIVPENRDPLIVPLFLNPTERAQLAEFVSNGLTDPRVASGLPPFDRPILHSERVPPNPALIGVGSPGAGGIEPVMIARTPPTAGSADFRIGVGRALGGARAILAVARQAGPPGQTVGGVPVSLALEPRPRLVRLDLAGTGAGAGEGFGTLHHGFSNEPRLVGQEFFAQWFVRDPAASGGLAATRGARFTIF